MTAHKSSDELKRHLFDRALRGARPSIKQLANEAGISTSLMDKIRWKQRRPTNNALNAFADGIELHASYRIHDARLLRAAVRMDATDHVELLCDAGGEVWGASINAEQILRRPFAEVCAGSFAHLFKVPPELRDGDEAQRVDLRYPDGRVDPACAIVTRGWTPPEREGDWRIGVLIRHSDGPRSEPTTIIGVPKRTLGSNAD